MVVEAIEQRETEIDQILVAGGAWAGVVEKYPDITLADLRRRVIRVVDPSGSRVARHETEAFKRLVLRTMQGWIDGLLVSHPQVGQRLDEQLNPDIGRSDRL